MMGKNTLAHDWPHCLLYTFLSVPLIRSTLHSIQQLGHRVLFVAPARPWFSTANLISGLNTLTTFSLSRSVVPNRWRDLAAMDRLPAPAGLAPWSKVQLLNTRTPSTQTLNSLRWKLISPLCWSSFRPLT